MKQTAARVKQGIVDARFQNDIWDMARWHFFRKACQHPKFSRRQGGERIGQRKLEGLSEVRTENKEPGKADREFKEDGGQI